MLNNVATLSGRSIKPFNVIGNDIIW